MSLTLNEVESNLLNIKSRLTEKKGELRVLLSQKDRLETKISKHKELERTKIQSKQLLVDTIKFAREEAKYIIENLVTKSLQYVFEDSTMRFKIEIKDKKNTTECNFLIVEDGEEMDPMESNGGGIIDIVSFILRIALIQANNNISLDDETESDKIKNQGPLILDEPFKHLSKDHIPKAVRFLRELSEKLGIQIIIITHNPELMRFADKRFSVHKENKESIVKEIIESDVDSYITLFQNTKVEVEE